MDRAMLASMREVETTHWWFVARRELLLSVLQRFVPEGATDLLDIGCGTGANLEAIHRLLPSIKAVGVDADSYCRSACVERGLRVLDSSATALSVGDSSQDVVCAFDVLEHLNDEGRALAEIERVLRPGGVLVLTVPAYQWLWGPHDELAHHRRRYTRRSVLKTLEGTSLEPLYATYFNTLLFPLAVAVRLAESALRRQTDEQSVPPRVLNATLRTVFRSERKALASMWRLPWGLSVLLVARRVKDRD